MDPTAPVTPAQPFMGAIPVSQQPTYPVQQVSAPAGGLSGGLVNKYAQVQAAVQGAQNQANQQAQMDRAATEFKEQQAASKAKGDVGTPETPAAQIPPGEHSATGDGHADFMGAVLQGLHSLGSGVSKIFGGGQPAPGAIPAPQQGPPAPAMPAPQQGAPAPGAAPMMKGGPVTNENARALRFMQGPTTGDPGPHSTILAFQKGGPIPSPSPAFGVHDGGVSGLRGFAQGGAIPTDAGPPAPAAAPAPQQGPPAPTAAPQAAPVSPEHARQEMTKAIVDAHTLLHDHTLNDNDVPNNQQAIPAGAPAPQAAAADTQAPQASPGSPPAAAPAANQAGAQAGPAAAPSAAGGTGPLAQATQAAVANAAQQGDAAHSNEGPTDSTRPHSITADQWDAFEQRKEYAVKMAAYAGQDPGQVRAAMDANRNAWVQGGVLKYLATANAAALKGDQAGVEKAMKNAYYYMPDGQELQTKKVGGQLQYQDPINPFVDSKTGAPVSGPNVPGAQPNMVPVDTRHIQMLGTAMLDPMNVQNTINNVRAAQAKIGLEQAQGQAAMMTGEGNLRKGTGIQATGESHLQRVTNENWKDLATGEAELMRATAVRDHLTNIVKQNKLDPQLLKGAQDASTTFDQTSQGQLSTVQPDTKNPLNPMNARAGAATRDPTKIPDELKGATPGDIADGKAMAGKLFLGSGGQMPPAEASRLAVLYTQQKRNTKAGPDGKQAGVYNDPTTGDMHIWNPKMKKWEVGKLPLVGANGTGPATMGVTASDLDPVAQGELARNSGGSGGGAIPSPDSMDTPDMEDQKFPES